MRKRTDHATHQSKEADSDLDPDPETSSSNLIAEFEQDLARILRSGLTRKRVPRERSETEKD
ncbi:hypothetical protein V1279_002353 [Bradyrhizobium sp. AZCC 1610]